MKLEQYQTFDSLMVVHRGPDGRAKPIFQEYKWVLKLLNKGLLSPHIPKIPYLFGRWQSYKEIK